MEVVNLIKIKTFTANGCEIEAVNVIKTLTANGREMEVVNLIRIKTLTAY